MARWWPWHFCSLSKQILMSSCPSGTRVLTFPEATTSLPHAAPQEHGTCQLISTICPEKQPRAPLPASEVFPVASKGRKAHGFYLERVGHNLEMSLPRKHHRVVAACLLCLLAPITDSPPSCSQASLGLLQSPAMRLWQLPH
jgi:hypothetical protein